MSWARKVGARHNPRPEMVRIGLPCTEGVRAEGPVLGLEPSSSCGILHFLNPSRLGLIPYQNQNVQRGVVAAFLPSHKRSQIFNARIHLAPTQKHFGFWVCGSSEGSLLSFWLGWCDVRPGSGTTLLSPPFKSSLHDRLRSRLLRIPA